MIKNLLMQKTPSPDGFRGDREIRVWDRRKLSVWKKTKPSRQPSGVSGKDKCYQKFKEEIMPILQNSGENRGSPQKPNSKTRQ